VDSSFNYTDKLATLRGQKSYSAQTRIIVVSDIVSKDGARKKLIEQAAPSSVKAKRYYTLIK